MTDAHPSDSPIVPLPAAPAPPPPPSGGWRRRTIALALVAALLLGTAGGGLAGAAVASWLLPPQMTLTAGAPALATPQLQPVAAVQTTANSTVITQVYTEVSPAVVRITNRGQRTATRSGIGTGSGFIIDKDGSIITNNHVVEGATRLIVTLTDGRELEAQVVGTAPGNDLALIKVEPPADGLPVTRLGDSDAVTPGETAIAIGSPLGLERTVTAGIVSSTGRTFNGGGRPLRGLIQTDTAINPGNSGGPLLNVQGEVIGINTLRAPDSQGIGFAVPVNSVKRLLPQLRAGGRISSPYLGIRGLAITPQLAQSLQLPVTEGVLVIEVVEGGPAAQAGLRGGPADEGQPAGQHGDIITAINGKPVRQVEEIGTILDAFRAGDSVPVVVQRDGQPTTNTVVLGEWPDS